LSSTKRDALVLVLVAVLLGASAYFAFPLSKTNLGLDLQGGLSVILEAQDSAKAKDIYGSMDAAIDRAKTIIQDRVNKLGVSEPEIQRQGATKISVQLPGIENTQQALETLPSSEIHSPPPKRRWPALEPPQRTCCPRATPWCSGPRLRTATELPINTTW
jgi:preprotein translocase subunit SecD